MPIYDNEKELVEVLGELLKSTGRFREVRTCLNLSAFKPENHWRKWYDSSEPTFQPEIDILIAESSYTGPIIKSIEVKYSRRKGGKLSDSFYAGIEQAIGTLRFGVDKALLWHFFDQEVELELIAKFVITCHRIIHTLELPISYSAYFLEEFEGIEEKWYPLPNRRMIGLKPIGPRIIPLQHYPPDEEKVEKLTHVVKWWEHYIYSKDKNPFFEEHASYRVREEVKRIREYIEVSLRIPRT